jgi:hypothetical protein
MKVIKKTAEYTVYQKRSGRYAVQSVARQWINGDDKVAILLSEDLIKAPEPKVIAVEPEPAESLDIGEDVTPAEPDAAASDTEAETETQAETPEAEVQDVQEQLAEASDAVGDGEASEAEGDEAAPAQKET